MLVAAGTLITIEGLDGAGKTTLANALAREIASRGHAVAVLREPGGVALSERIRALVKDPSLAYQGAGRALGVEDVRTVNAFATGGLRPDRTLLLRISPSAGRARQQGRAREQGGLGEAGAGPDRLEREDDAFFEAIGAAYEQLAQAEPQRIRSIDASQAPDEVLRDAIAAIEDLVVASSAEPRG